MLKIESVLETRILNFENVTNNRVKGKNACVLHLNILLEDFIRVSNSCLGDRPMFEQNYEKIIFVERFLYTLLGNMERFASILEFWAEIE